jgi:hypothetical protein
MATSYINGVVFTPVSNSTVDFVVSAAVTGWQTPAGATAVDGSTFRYRAASADLSQWEDGTGVYTVSTTTLTRATVKQNSLGTTAKINFLVPPQVSITVFDDDLTAFVSNTDSRVLSGNLNFTGTNSYFSTGWFVTANVSANTTALIVNNTILTASLLTIGGNPVANSTGANNAFNLGGVAAASYVNTSGNYTITGIHTHNANLSVNGAVFLSGSNGAVGQVWTSNGTSNSYWSTPAGGAPSNFSANIGNTTGTSFVITHNMNKSTLFFSVLEISSGYEVYPDVVYNTTNTCTVNFVTAPTANQYTITVLGV